MTGESFIDVDFCQQAKHGQVVTGDVFLSRKIKAEGRVISVLSDGLGSGVKAAVLANLINNLPAVLLLLPAASVAGPGAVLAVLIGVNTGPNLTYVGSLATLLWRRVLVRTDSTLADLHWTLQILFCWTDFHLHRFRIRKTDYAIPRHGLLEGHDARRVRLTDLAFRPNERFL